MTMTNRTPHPFELVVAIILIGVQCCFRVSELLNKRAQGGPLGVLHHPNTDLS